MTGQNNYRTIVTLATHTFPRGDGIVEYEICILPIPSGPAMGSLPPAGSSVLLAGPQSELPKNNSTVSDDFSFARLPCRKTFWDSPRQYI